MRRAGYVLAILGTVGSGCAGAASASRADPSAATDAAPAAPAPSVASAPAQDPPREDRGARRRPSLDERPATPDASVDERRATPDASVDERRATPDASLVGRPAPDFDGQSGTGPVSLSRWRGKVVVVDFWATWCEPCRRAFPGLEALRAKYAPRGLEIVAVSLDDEPRGPLAFAAAHGAKFPIVWDKGSMIARKYRPAAMPSAFVIDKKGVVRFVHFGYHEEQETKLEEEVKSLL